MNETTQNTPENPMAKFIRQQDVQLRQVAGIGEGRVFPLTEGDSVIGSDLASSIRVEDKTVSRRHCVIERGENQLRIRDLQSTNGTAVDGVTVETAYLRPGMKVRTGNAVFSVEVGYAPLATEQVRPSGFRGLVGDSPQMRAIFSAREQLVNSNVTLLIHGETGTGKSALARSVHQASSKRDEPFIVFDCGAVSANLIESELFGHEKGAFTGADRQRIGAVEAAGSGMLFIDELTELPLDLQPKLLRALEERQFSRVGSHEQRPVKCRIIAASQHDVWERCEAGKFRRDLYYRLAVVLVPLPPLRERKQDLKQIVDHLLLTMEAPFLGFNHLPESVREQITKHDWPGNVRELRNFLERYIVTRVEVPLRSAAPQQQQTSAKGTPLAGLDLQRPFKDLKSEVVERFERAYLVDLLHRAEHNVSQAAKISGIARRNLHELLLKHGLDRDSLVRGAIAKDED